MSLYGFIIGICFLLGFEYFVKTNKIIPKNKENIFLILLFIFSLIGARTFYVISNWNYYSQNLSQIINTRGGGLAIHGGLLTGILFIFIFSKINKIKLLKITDSITPIIPLCQSIGRLGNFFNKEIPTWWLESILNLILFFIIIKTKKNQTALYLIGYGSIRFFTEFFRTDTWQISNLKIPQLISLIFIIIGIFLLPLNRFFTIKNQIRISLRKRLGSKKPIIG